MTEHSCIADYGVVLISGVQQHESVSCIPALFFFGEEGFFSHVGDYRVLSTFPCAIHSVGY